MKNTQQEAIMRLLLETYGRDYDRDNDALLNEMQKEIQTIEGEVE